MALVEKKNLQKQGVEFDERTMKDYQERELTTTFTKQEFYGFWNRSEPYKVELNDDGSLDVKRKHYNSELKEMINVPTKLSHE